MLCANAWLKQWHKEVLGYIKSRVPQLAHRFCHTNATKIQTVDKSPVRIVSQNEETVREMNTRSTKQKSGKNTTA